MQFQIVILNFETFIIGIRIRKYHGMKNPKTFLHRLCHSISYDMVWRLETAQAELSQELLKASNLIPLKLDDEGGAVTNLVNFDNVRRKISEKANWKYILTFLELTLARIWTSCFEISDHVLSHTFNLPKQ